MSALSGSDPPGQQPANGNATGELGGANNKDWHSNSSVNPRFSQGWIGKGTTEHYDSLSGLHLHPRPPKPPVTVPLATLPSVLPAFAAGSGGPFPARQHQTAQVPNLRRLSDSVALNDPFPCGGHWLTRRPSRVPPAYLVGQQALDRESVQMPATCRHFVHSAVAAGHTVSRRCLPLALRLWFADKPQTGPPVR